ncbi:MAG TPA: PQQ-binding-like beta-propeller repeat protein [Caulobacteraceae bacterium]|nr:PQQ-binding-like beta-propeller repeat protein [Caulobacteraceae bacterium]
MRTGRVLGLVMVLAAAMATSGCIHINNPFHNPFQRSKTSKYSGSGERINVLPADTVTVSDALRGQDFFLPDPQPNAAWPLPGGTPEQSVERPSAGASFQVAWRRKFGRASNRDYHVTAPPVAADGRIYVMDGEAAVSAFDLNDGREIWRRELGERSRSQREAFGGGLAFADGRLFVTSGYRFVAALDAATGKLIWRTQTDAPVHAAPTVADGRVYAESTDDNLLTFDAATGQPGWSHQALVETARLLSATSPAISGDAVVAAFASGEVVAMQTANGNQLWSVELSKSNRNSALSEIRDIAGRPVIYHGDVYAASHSGVMSAIDMRTGAQRWALPITSITTPWPVGDVVYVTDTQGRVICASRDSGQVYWITDLNLGLPQKKRADWSGPMLSGPNLVLVSSLGEAVALNPKTGVAVRRLKLGSDSLLTPIAVGPDLYVATQAAELIAIR